MSITSIIGIIGPIIVVIGGLLTFYKGYGILTEKINGVGGRVSELEKFKAKVETNMENTDRLLNNMRLEIVGKMGDLERAVNSNHGRIRERVVALEVIYRLKEHLGVEFFGSEES